MRAAFTLNRATIVVASLLACGCATAPRGTPIGMSDAVPDKPPEPQVQPLRAPWQDFVAARAWPEAAPAAVALAHFRDGTRVHVRVEPGVLAAYRDLTVETGMPEGARLVAWHEAAGGSLLGGYVLEKRSGTWTPLEVDAAGVLVSGDHARCVRCHDMAPTDHLFGVRAQAPAPGPQSQESNLLDAR